MLLRILKNNTTAGYLLIPLLTVIAWWPALKSDSWQQMVFDFIPMPIYDLIKEYIIKYLLWSKILAMLLVMVTGFYLIRLNNKYLFIKERTLLPAFFFIMIVSCLTALHRLHPALIAVAFFLPVLSTLLASYKKERLSYNYFEAAFLIGTGSLVYFNLIYFIFLVWLALLILRPVIWREWMFSILGLATPWLFFLFIDYFIHDSLDWSIGLITANFTTDIVFNLILLPEKIFFSFIILILILASRTIARSIQQMKVLSRKIFILFFWTFSIVLAVFFLVETAYIELIVIATIPISFLLSHFVLSMRSRFWSNLLLWCIIWGLQILVWLPSIFKP